MSRTVWQELEEVKPGWWDSGGFVTSADVHCFFDPAGDAHYISREIAQEIVNAHRDPGPLRGFIFGVVITAVAFAAGYALWRFF